MTDTMRSQSCAFMYNAYKRNVAEEQKKKENKNEFAICFWIWFLWMVRRACSCIYHIRAHIQLKLYTFIWDFFFPYSTFSSATFLCGSSSFACIADVDIFSIRAKNRRRKKNTHTHDSGDYNTRAEKKKKRKQESESYIQVWKRLRHYRVWMFCICAHFNTCNAKKRRKKNRFKSVRLAVEANQRHIQLKGKIIRKYGNRFCCCCGDEAVTQFLVLCRFYLHVCKAIT